MRYHIFWNTPKKEAYILEKKLTKLWTISCVETKFDPETFITIDKIHICDILFSRIHQKKKLVFWTICFLLQYSILDNLKVDPETFMTIDKIHIKFTWSRVYMFF